MKDIFALVFSIIACITSFIILILILKNNKSGNTILSDEQHKKIKEAINESVGNMSTPISALVAEKNATLINNLIKITDDTTKKIGNLTKSQNDLNNHLLKFKDETVQSLTSNNEKTNKIINDFIKQYIESNQKQKDEIMTKLSSEIRVFNDTVKKTLEDFNKSIKEKLEEFKINTIASFKELNENVNKNLCQIQKDNDKKLQQINDTVNEKLQKTLEEKLKDSFKSVIEGIGYVNKTIGEIKGLATDVHLLKNVLTNVKTQGISGEVILGNIIKEYLTKGQYEENFATKRGSSERVEFAIKIPGINETDYHYIPVDSKFPLKQYQIIQESSNINEIKDAKKAFKNSLLQYAKNVSEKYIDFPSTVNFAIIFLPLEGLYLEAINMNLWQDIYTKYKIVLTGPTTFSGIINALSLGFKQLKIQKKSKDIIKLLGAIKNEFGKFAKHLDNTQKKINAAANELDTLVGSRTRMINSKLKNIDALDDNTTKLILDNQD